MTSGLGISIGTVNVVSARVGAEAHRPTVRTRRTAVGFDDRGTARLGGITRFSMAVSEFADLGRDPEPVYVDGRIWSPASIFASVVHGLVSAEPATAVVATHPGGYTAKHIGLLRQSLEFAGAGHIRLVPEPVAATHWLDTEHGPLDTGFTLVYDLGGNSLDIAVVRTGPDWPDHPMVGNPVRSYEFGGRPLGTMIARYAGDRAIGAAEPGTGAVSLMSFVDPEGLRREHVRDSLEVVRSAVRSAGVALSDIDRILLVGGAARPAQVAETLAELGIPVTVAADSGQCVALGAATMAAANVPAPASRSTHPPIFSGAAVFSAVAMSAATVLGHGGVDAPLPEPERMPLEKPGAALYEVHGEAQVERSDTGWTVSYAPPESSALIAPAAQARSYGPPMPGSEASPGPFRTDDPAGPDSRPSPRASHPDPDSPYDDPAVFHNPIPFERPDIPWRPDGSSPGAPRVELPEDSPGSHMPVPEIPEWEVPDHESPHWPGVDGGGNPPGEESDSVPSWSPDELDGDTPSTPEGLGDSWSDGNEGLGGRDLPDGNDWPDGAGWAPDGSDRSDGGGSVDGSDGAGQGRSGRGGPGQGGSDSGGDQGSGGDQNSGGNQSSDGSPGSSGTEGSGGNENSGGGEDSGGNENTAPWYSGTGFHGDEYVPEPGDYLPGGSGGADSGNSGGFGHGNPGGYGGYSGGRGGSDAGGSDSSSGAGSDSGGFGGSGFGDSGGFGSDSGGPGSGDR